MQLQRFGLDQLTLLGVVWGDSPLALVQDPERHVHVVQIGTYVGPNWGRVTAVSSERVVVTEEWRDGDGRVLAEQHVLGLPVEEAYDLGR